MGPKKIQKMFYYSSEYVKKFIESRIEDIAIKEQRSSSYIIENILLDRLLPKNNDARWIVQTYLYPDDERGGVQKTLEALFSQNSAGINWNSKHDNFKPLVEYCLLYTGSSSRMANGKPELHHFINQLESIVDRIEECTKVCIEKYDRQMFEQQAALAKILLETAKKSPEDIMFNQHFQLVLDCWDMLKDWSITYRYLADLVAMYEWTENTNARNALYDIIDTISAEW